MMKILESKKLLEKEEEIKSVKGSEEYRMRMIEIEVKCETEKV